MKKVLLIASYDSFLNSGYAVAKEIKDAQIDIYIHKSRENILSNRQLLESGIDKDQAIFFHIDDYFIMQISHQTVGSAIGHFPKLAAGESNPHVANHEAMNHSAQMLEKMAFVKNGGNRNDIPEPLRPKTGDIRKYIRYNSNKTSRLYYRRYAQSFSL